MESLNAKRRSIRLQSMDSTAQSVLHRLLKKLKEECAQCVMILQ
jgi:hypothetical protein